MLIETSTIKAVTTSTLVMAYCSFNRLINLLNSIYVSMRISLIFYCIEPSFYIVRNPPLLNIIVTMKNDCDIYGVTGN